MQPTENMPQRVPERIVELSQKLPPEKQAEVLDFVSFLLSRQAPGGWTLERRRRVAARTLGSLSNVPTSSESFSSRKAEEKAKEERRWKP
ncbi:MAG: DUF2281 domain-containing protein [Acidobacteriota bacterium]